MYSPQFGQTTCDGTAVLHSGQVCNAFGFLASCDRRVPVRELVCFRFGTAIVLLNGWGVGSAAIGCVRHLPGMVHLRSVRRVRNTHCVTNPGFDGYLRALRNREQNSVDAAKSGVNATRGAQNETPY